MPESSQRPQDRQLPAVRQEPEPRELVTVRARADLFRARLDESRERFRLALEQLSESTAAMSPATRIRAHPWGFILGGFALGVLFGLATSRKSSND